MEADLVLQLGLACLHPSPRGAAEHAAGHTVPQRQRAIAGAARDDRLLQHRRAVS
ncbi:hypothetical protein C2845_PM11G19650 [Panicum miliaceum]|uniref:Uncharacterized protein n=1 Tax=Panicum miliaceum TaxID=4540 RepID=A0A3L6RV68_PANMI|nr:hypothetical protein C2845_PM11G19650 [Panicum miliaceum]